MPAFPMMISSLFPASPVLFLNSFADRFAVSIDDKSSGWKCMEPLAWAELRFISSWANATPSRSLFLSSEQT